MGLLYSLLFVGMTVIAVIVGGGSVMGFVDLTSLAIVIASVLLFVLASGQWSVFSQGLKHFFQFHDHSQVDRNDAAKIRRFFRLLGIACPAIGFFWTIVGVIIMLSNLSPETIGSGLGIALLTMLYSCLLSIIVFFPISAYFASVTTDKHVATKQRQHKA